MAITHNVKTSVRNIVASTAGFDIDTNCHALLIDNNGDDNVRIFFNNDAVNYYLLKAGSALPVKTDNEDEIITDVIKIQFVTEVNPLVNILLQTKALIR